METGFDQLTGSQLLAVVDRALDALADPRHLLADDRDQLDLLAASLRVAARLNTWQAMTAARLDNNEVAWRVHATSTATWLADTANLTAREAHRLVHAGRGLHRFPILAEASATGAVLPTQTEAITSVLDDLPDDLPDAVVAQAQNTMVGFAASYNSTELRRLARHLLDVVAPETAEALEAGRVERDHRLAERSRHLSFIHDHHGSILIRGSLPVVAAEPLVRIVEAYAAAEKRALDALDPHAEYVTPATRRADGLLAMVHHHGQRALAPSHGGDRPRISVTLSYEALLDAGRDGMPIGRLTTSGEPIPAGQLRQLLCDADVLPAVLGGRSEVLDVGRAQRLVTPPIRAALDLRDQGCIFPGCDKPPTSCQAHHLIPWWAGGRTSLSNLVLACAHHHGIVEPGHDPTADRWRARLGEDGIAEVIPPLRVDPQQRARRHARFREYPEPYAHPQPAPAARPPSGRLYDPCPVA